MPFVLVQGEYGHFPIFDRFRYDVRVKVEMNPFDSRKEIAGSSETFVPSFKLRIFSGDDDDGDLSQVAFG